jgi:hypothetical protein
MAQINENLHVDAQLSAKTLSFPDKSLPASAAFHHFPVQYRTKEGVDCVTESYPIHTAYRDGTLIAIEVMVVTPPTDTRTLTVDLKKGSQASGFATVLSAPITINSGTAARQVVVGVLTTTAIADGDTLELVITVGGAAGNHAQGLSVTVFLQQPAK